MKEWLRHWINPLHVYCRMCKRIGRKQALVVSRAYEVMIYSMILGKNSEKGGILW